MARNNNRNQDNQTTEPAVETVVVIDNEPLATNAVVDDINEPLVDDTTKPSVDAGIPVVDGVNVNDAESAQVDITPVVTTEPVDNVYMANDGMVDVNPLLNVESEPIDVKTEITDVGLSGALQTGEEKTVDPLLAVKQHIHELKLSSPVIVKNFIARLEDYNTTMKPGVAFDQEKMLNAQYELVNIIRATLNKVTYVEFKTYFDIINKFFHGYSDEAFGGALVFRFDHLWKHTEKELNTLLNLATVLTTLSNPITRKENLAKISFDIALDQQKTIVSEEAKNFIIRYYNN